MVAAGLCRTSSEAVKLGKDLLAQGYLSHVLKEHDFQNDYLFYRFAEDFHDDELENCERWEKNVDGKNHRERIFLAPWFGEILGSFFQFWLNMDQQPAQHAVAVVAIMYMMGFT